MPQPAIGSTDPDWRPGAEAGPTINAPITDLDEKQVRDCDQLLAAAAAWLVSNADRWVRDKVASPGLISDSICKIVDQRLDMEKQAGEKAPEGHDIGSALAQIMGQMAGGGMVDTAVDPTDAE